MCAKLVGCLRELARVARRRAFLERAALRRRPAEAVQAEAAGHLVGEALDAGTVALLEEARHFGQRLAPRREEAGQRTLQVGVDFYCVVRPGLAGRSRPAPGAR